MAGSHRRNWPLADEWYECGCRVLGSKVVGDGLGAIGFCVRTVTAQLASRVRMMVAFV